MSIKKNRLLYYCQSLVGIGHLTASLHIIEELLQYYNVDLVYGGLPYSAFPKQEGFRILTLPALLFDEAGELYSSGGAHTVEEVWALRQSAIHDFVHPGYAGIVLEFYPFGRRRFKKEIRGLCNQIKRRSGNIPVFCQVREVLVPTDRESEQLILNMVEAEIHTVLVRGDPSVVRLDQSFLLASRLAGKLFYGGYVSPPAPPDVFKRGNRILVSQGGGTVGKELLLAAIRTAPLLPDYQFLIAAGSAASEAELLDLQAAAKSSNAQVVPFLNDFRSHLASSALSINMGGDNTLLDAIVTKTPSLAFPYPGNAEQHIRIEQLAKQGWVNPLAFADLTPQRLKQRILDALNKPYPDKPINLNGAINISNKIHEFVSEFLASP